MNIWTVVTARGEAAAVRALLPAEAEVSTLVLASHEVAEEAACGAARVVWIDTTNALPESFAEAAADALAEADVVLGVAVPGTRAALGIVAMRKDASIVSNVVSFEAAEGELRVDHLTVDDKVRETVTAPMPTVLLTNPLTVSIEVRPEGTPAPIESLDAQPSDAVSIASRERIPASGLETAERVVSIGRGIKNKEVFAQVQGLADVLGAEIGCTMPISTDYDYLPADAHYVGLSGLKVHPQLYLALGISGSSQHLAGIRNAKTVVVVNKDENAKFFDNADYGIVGEVEQVIPELVRALS